MSIHLDPSTPLRFTRSAQDDRGKCFAHGYIIPGIWERPHTSEGVCYKERACDQRKSRWSGKDAATGLFSKPEPLNPIPSLATYHFHLSPPLL